MNQALKEKEAALEVDAPAARQGLASQEFSLTASLQTMPQAKLLQAESDCKKAGEEKTAALKHVAELESMNADLSDLEGEVSELTEQLQLAASARQAQQKEVQELRKLAEDLEARNSVLVASEAAAREKGAELQVGHGARSRARVFHGMNPCARLVPHAGRAVTSRGRA